MTEARKLSIPIVAVVDTNCDPDLASTSFRATTTAIRSGLLMSRIISDAVIEGKRRRAAQGIVDREPKPEAPVQPRRSAEEEAQHRAAQDAARSEAAAARHAPARPAWQQPRTRLPLLHRLLKLRRPKPHPRRLPNNSPASTNERTRRTTQRWLTSQHKT